MGTQWKHIMTRHHTQKIQRLEAAVAQYEAKLEAQIIMFRKCVDEYDLEHIVTFLPEQILIMQETRRDIRKLKAKLWLIKFLADGEHTE